MNKTEDKMLSLIRDAIKNGLLENGGRANGSETYAKGTISRYLSGSLAIMTPQHYIKTGQQMHDLSRTIEEKCKGILDKYKYDGNIKVEYIDTGHGCFRTIISLEQSKIVL